jgi:hypothetical protein
MPFRAIRKKMVAYLHDVAEKARRWSLQRLRNEGFSQFLVSAVDALARREGEADDEFLRRAISKPLARPVKMADLEDNLSQAGKAGGDISKYVAGLSIARGKATVRPPPFCIRQVWSL